MRAAGLKSSAAVRTRADRGAHPARRTAGCDPGIRTQAARSRPARLRHTRPQTDARASRRTVRLRATSETGRSKISPSDGASRGQDRYARSVSDAGPRGRPESIARNHGVYGQKRTPSSPARAVAAPRLVGMSWLEVRKTSLPRSRRTRKRGSAACNSCEPPLEGAGRARRSTSAKRSRSGVSRAHDGSS